MLPEADPRRRSERAPARLRDAPERWLTHAVMIQWLQPPGDPAEMETRVMRIPHFAFVLVSVAALLAAVGCLKGSEQAAGLVAQADSLFEAKKYNDAYTLYKQAVSKDPKNVHALVRLGECCLWLHDSERGLAWVEKALAVDPNYATAWEKKGELLMSQKRGAEAVACFEKALALDGKLNAARLNLALAYEGMGMTDRALQMGRDAVAMEPKSAETHFKYGVTLLLAKRQAEAEAEFRRTLNLDPNHTGAMLRLAGMLVEQKRGLSEARRLAQKADQIGPGEGDAAVLAAWALFLSGDRKAAVQELEQVARAHPTNFVAWARLAGALRDMGFEDAARRAGQIAAQVAPRPPALLGPPKEAGSSAAR